MSLLHDRFESEMPQTASAAGGQKYLRAHGQDRANCRHRTSLRHKLSPTVPELTADTPKARPEKGARRGSMGAIHRLHSRPADRPRRLLPPDRHDAHLD
jgi:hypothetical protein